MRKGDHDSSTIPQIADMNDSRKVMTATSAGCEAFTRVLIDSNRLRVQEAMGRLYAHTDGWAACRIGWLETEEALLVHKVA